MSGSDATRATIYIAPEAFDAASAEVTGDAYRHLFRARRLAVGDALRAVDGRGRAREARVARVARASARLDLGTLQPSRDAARSLRLIVAAPRAERASWLVEKATELGVAGVAWLECERSARTFAPRVLARQQRVAIAALEQCGGATLPVITGPHAWSEMTALVAGFESCRFLDPQGSRRVAPAAGTGTLGLVIGPEGGWTEAERTALLATGAEAWSLGERVLRVETAAVVGAALSLLPPP